MNRSGWCLQLVGWEWDLGQVQQRPVVIDNGSGSGGVVGMGRGGVQVNNSYECSIKAFSMDALGSRGAWGLVLAGGEIQTGRGSFLERLGRRRFHIGVAGLLWPRQGDQERQRGFLRLYLFW